MSNLKVAHFSFRTEVKEKAAELDILKDTMASEQKKSRELQWALEKEKAKMERSEERGREELEVFHNPKWPGTSRNTQIFFRLTNHLGLHFCPTCAPFSVFNSRIISSRAEERCIEAEVAKKEKGLMQIPFKSLGI